MEPVQKQVYEKLLKIAKTINGIIKGVKAWEQIPQGRFNDIRYDGEVILSSCQFIIQESRPLEHQLAISKPVREIANVGIDLQEGKMTTWLSLGEAKKKILKLCIVIKTKVLQYPTVKVDKQFKQILNEYLEGRG